MYLYLKYYIYGFFYHYVKYQYYKKCYKVKSKNFRYLYLVIYFIVVENHGQDSKDDNKLRPISCFIEGAIHNILLHIDDAQNVCFFFFLIFYYLY